MGHRDATDVADVVDAAEVDKEQRDVAEGVHNAAGAGAGLDSGGLVDNAAGAAADDVGGAAGVVGAAAAGDGRVEVEGGCATLAGKAS